ncbi:MAG: LPS export ABC transporter periplasmic protein LptC [Bacteroidales bacterium]|nr:LPS export ABC transporter periplasmic protein LptC [Bacteroidales bacterium]
MKNPHRISVILKGLVVFAASLLAVISCRRNGGDGEVLDPAEIPVQEVDSMFVVQTENGILKSRIEATLMQKFELDTISYDMFKNGFAVYSYDEQGNLESVITAQTARHSKFNDGSEKWEAFGNVVIKNVIKHETMETDTIYWNRTEEKIWTHCFVKMYSPKGYMQGYGMQSDQRANNSVILKPFDSFGYVVEDSTKVILDTANFVGPLPKK